MKPAFQKLAETLNLTSPDPEPYILTEAEEKEIIAHAIEQKITHARWKMEGLLSRPEIENRLRQVDWIKQIDREEILKSANSTRLQEVWHAEQRQKEKEAATAHYQELKQRCDSKYMFRLMKWASQNRYQKPLIVNDDNKHLITAICYFLSEDPKFETDLGYDPNKGLLIRGVSGIGKTHLVRCVEDNDLNPVLVLSMLEITDTVASTGEYHIQLGHRKVIYLDDVGTEEAVVNHYGTKISFFKNFVEMVYLRNQVFNKLMVSTNNSFQQLEEKYGFRVRSRIKDMFNIIDVKGEDMRGKV